MGDMLGVLGVVFVLVFLFRRQIKRASRKWGEAGTTARQEELADIIARERQRMRQRAESEGRPGPPPQID